MWIRLLKSHIIHNGKKLPIGQNLQVTTEYGKPLIESGIAEEYNGNRKIKMKTKLFKNTNGNIN